MIKKLYTGLIVFDVVDVICISFSTGSGIALLVRKYKKYTGKIGPDPIVMKLKKSSLTMFSRKRKLLKLPPNS
jgi:hypothetical protein